MGMLLRPYWQLRVKGEGLAYRWTGKFWQKIRADKGEVDGDAYADGLHGGFGAAE